MDMKAAGARLRKLRGDIPVRVAAAQLDISSSALICYEHGTKIPRDDVKEKLADFYGTTVPHIFWPECLLKVNTGGGR